MQRRERMTLTPMHEAFKSVPLFAGLDDRELEAVITISRTRSYP